MSASPRPRVVKATRDSPGLTTSRKSHTDANNEKTVFIVTKGLPIILLETNDCHCQGNTVGGQTGILSRKESKSNSGLAKRHRPLTFGGGGFPSGVAADPALRQAALLAISKPLCLKAKEQRIFHINLHLTYTQPFSESYSNLPLPRSPGTSFPNSLKPLCL